MKTQEKASIKVFYQDSRFSVTSTDVRTPSAFYPVADTIGRVRRDLIFAASAFAVITGLALLIYWDLWYWNEIVLMVGGASIALFVASQISILQLDARGFPARLFFARRKTVKAIFKAITNARASSQNDVGSKHFYEEPAA